MIDDTNKLYLLEINYTPSFSTETPLDHLIKSNLIRDTMVLMNVTPAARDKAVRQAKEVVDRRVYTGKINKISPEERQRLVR
jgi:tubulin polyglutamylase TTLL6/13